LRTFAHSESEIGCRPRIARGGTGPAQHPVMDSPMFERILMPLDGTKEGEAVLLPLRHVLRRKDSEVILLRAASIVPSSNLNAGGFNFAGELERAAAYLESVRARFEGEGLRVRTLCHEGDPADVILQSAEAENATLIALSTHGRTGFSRWTRGSVTEAVLRRSPIPVLVDRHVAEPQDRGRLKTILVAFDGRPESLAITPEVIELARLLEAGIALVKVEEADGHGPDLGFIGHRLDGPLVLDDLPDLLDRDLIEAGNPFAEAGLPTTVFRVRGAVSDQINNLARILPADLIAMSTHGRRGMARLISGSVTEQVVRSATIPMLVMNSGARQTRPEAGDSA
jgi:nucleotide-binding universal stress UspA family protein